MHMLQLNSSIPMMTPRGPGFAILCLDYSQEHDLIWCVALTESGEMWCLRNQDVRIDKNYTLGRNGPRPLALPWHFKSVCTPPSFKHAIGNRLHTAARYRRRPRPLA